MKKAFVLLPLLLATTALPSQESVLLRFSPKPNQVVRYAYQMDNVSMTLNLKVIAVKNGKTTLHSRIEGMSVDGSPAPESVAADVKKALVIMVKDERGRVLSEVVKGGPKNGLGVEPSTLAFPEKPLKVGESWKNKIKKMGIPVEAIYKLVGVKMVDNRRAAILHTSFVGMPEGIQFDLAESVMEISTGFPISVQTSGSYILDGAIHSFSIKMTRL